MKLVLTGQDMIVSQWVMKKVGGAWVPGMTGIGLFDTERAELIAGVAYFGYNQVNIFAHIAGDSGAHWMTRDFLWYIFHYPFVELGCKRITGLVPSWNEAALRLDRKFGFVEEATLKDADPDGDIKVLVCWRENARRWLQLRDRKNGNGERQQRASNT